MSHEQPVKVSNNGTLNGHSLAVKPDPEVVPKAERRTFSAEYKLRILAEGRCLYRTWRCGRPIATRSSLLITSGQVAYAAPTWRAAGTGSAETRIEGRSASDRDRQAAARERVFTGSSGASRDDHRRTGLVSTQHSYTRLSLALSHNS
jgi:hypothetical protein